MSEGARPAPDADSAMLDAARLFNERAYYESHDVLEEEWADSRGVRREVLKALVKLAAGMYHLQTSGYRGAGSLLSSGLAALDALPPDALFFEIPPLAGSGHAVPRETRNAGVRRDGRVGRRRPAATPPAARRLPAFHLPSSRVMPI